MDKIPIELLNNILHILPPSAVLPGKLVCKKWKALLGDGVTADYIAELIHDDQTHMIEWARSLGCPLTEAALVMAITRDHVDLARQLFDGCKKSFSTIYAAVTANNKELLELIYSTGMMTHKVLFMAMMYAAVCGKKPALKWFNKKCPNLTQADVLAVLGKQMNILAWLAKKGQISIAAFAVCCSIRNNEMIEYLSSITPMPANDDLLCVLRAMYVNNDIFDWAHEHGYIQQVPPRPPSFPYILNESLCCRTYRNYDKVPNVPFEEWVKTSTTPFRTPTVILAEAIELNNVELAKWLLFNGVEFTDFVFGDYSNSKLKRETANLLLEFNIPIADRDWMNMVSCKKYHSIKLLIELGVPMPERAITHAMNSKDRYLTKWFLKHGAKFTVDSLHQSAQYGSKDSIKWAIKHGYTHFESLFNFVIRMNVADILRWLIKKRYHIGLDLCGMVFDNNMTGVVPILEELSCIRTRYDRYRVDILRSTYDVSAEELDHVRRMITNSNIDLLGFMGDENFNPFEMVHPQRRHTTLMPYSINNTSMSMAYVESTGDVLQKMPESDDNQD